MTTRFRAAVIGGVLSSAVGTAGAQELSLYDVKPGEAALTAGSTAGLALLIHYFFPVNDHEPKDKINPLDHTVTDNFDRGAAWASQFALVGSLTAPIGLFASRPADDLARDRTLLYAESIGVTALATGVLKKLVGRPRPYTHNPEAREYVREQGKDAYVSFPSGHASFSFAAAVAGGLMYSMETDDVTLRATAWGAQLALATATSNFRVRSGKHFYTDILAGALLGTGVSAVVVLSAARDGYTPTGTEVGAMAGGVAVGWLLSEVFPTGNERLDKKKLALTPIGGDHMTGFALLGGF